MIVNEGTNRAVRLHKDRLLALPNVNGVVEGYKTRAGIRTDEPAVVVLVERKKPIEPSILKRVIFRRLHPANAVPSMVEGVQTDVIEVGKIVAFKESCAKKEVIGPGAGIGHPNVTCGSFGLVAIDEQTGGQVVVTNNHVAAASNKGKEGDPILYPCGYCGGGPEDAFGRLGRFVPIELMPNPCALLGGFVRAVNLLLGLLGRHSQITIKEAGGENLVDAAIVIPEEAVQITSEIPEIGTPSPGIIEAYVGLRVEKTGWRTWHTKGEVIGVGGTVQVSYGNEGIATFTDQIVIGPIDGNVVSAGGDSGSGIVARETQMSEPGDAGSIILMEGDGEIKAVALLFAGSDEVTIANRAANVEKLLGVRFGG